MRAAHDILSDIVGMALATSFLGIYALASATGVWGSIWLLSRCVPDVRPTSDAEKAEDGQ